MVCLENVVKIYKTRTGQVKALDSINLKIQKGEFIVIRGPSGSGKTTLLMTIAGMLHPTSGTVAVEQNNLYEMSGPRRAKFRAQSIGFIFQMFYLVPYLNVIENVILAGRVIGKKNGKDEVIQLLKQLGLERRAFHRPGELSAGEKQRVAIARALFNNPKVILADEPTGNLDGDNAKSVIKHISGFHRSGGTVLLATHGTKAKSFADRIIHLSNGRIVKMGKDKSS